MDDLKNTLRNFFNGRYTRRECFSVYQGFEKGDGNEIFLEELEKQWEDIDPGTPLGFDQKLAWNKIARKIDTASIPPKRTVTIWQFIQKAAAILFLPLLIASLFYYYTVNNEAGEGAWAEIKCPPGIRTEFQLPDGSTGFLNSESTLKYPLNFKDNREVSLSGEAFFDVLKDEKNKFRVTTQRLKVEVLGTSFNIMAHEGQPYEEITLKTGSLKILSKNDAELSKLAPNQQLVLDKEQSRFIKKEVNAFNFTSWTTGKLVIQDQRFEDVAKKLSRWYDVDIEIEGQELKDFRYYATFENEPLSEVLRLITATAPIQYKEETRVKNIDGSFSKRKIKFKLNEDRLKDFN
jgi:ferric-dicitrate binding protein FerR (iron transport regulator)